MDQILCIQQREETVMPSAFTYQQVTVPTLDAVLSNLRSQHVPVSKMAALYREVQYWEKIRHAKMTEQGSKP